MADPTSMWEQARARQEYLLREAEIDRLLTEAGVAHSSLQARVLHRLGAFLTFCGERLGAPSTSIPSALPRAEATPAALLPADQLEDWRILADGTLVTLAPGASIAPEADAPVSVVIRLERTPGGRVSVLCWNAESGNAESGNAESGKAESGGAPGEANERRMALFYMTQELVPAQ